MVILLGFYPYRMGVGVKREETAETSERWQMWGEQHKKQDLNMDQI